jgi:hypothetical protein
VSISFFLGIFYYYWTGIGGPTLLAMTLIPVVFAARCFLVTQEADSVELGTWCWPRVVLIEKRPLTECERSSMNRAARSVGACQSRQRPSAAFCRASGL